MSGEFLNQYVTHCKFCGQQIVMTLTNEGWKPCDPVLTRFIPSGGPETFVTHEGKLCRGKRDSNGEYGYRKHYASCRRNRYGTA